MMNKLQLFLQKQLRDFDDASFIRLLKIFAFVAALVIAYALIFFGYLIVDEFEHLHASWLVSTGQMPYRDFLEHHNPLLWYISAPIVQLFYDNAVILYVMRAVTVIVSILILMYIYKIALFFGDKKSSWLAIVLYLSNSVALYNFYQFRPDNYMNLCFIAGIYYLFSAIKTNRTCLLTLSFLCFTFSFLFLQKISFLLLIVELILFWLIWSKKLKLKTITIAAIPSVLILFLFLWFLYLKDALEVYWELNFIFNKAMVSYYEYGGFWYNNLIFTLFGVAFFCALLFYKKENIYFKIVAILFVAEFLLRGFYFSPYPHYYLSLAIFSSLLLSVLVDKLLIKHKFISAILIIILFLNLGRLYNQLEKTIYIDNGYKHYLLSDWAHKNSQSDDILMNGHNMIFNIYRPDVSYYWFGLDLLSPIIEREYNLAHKIDVNNLIISKRPKFVYAANYFDAVSFRRYGERKYAQKFIPELIGALYKPTPFSGLWELK